MNKLFHSGARILITAALCVCMLGTMVAAAIDVVIPISVVTIPVAVDTSGEDRESIEIYNLHISNETGAPMPEGAVDGVYDFQIEGEATVDLVITYDRVGLYEYKVWQDPGTDDRCPYDGAVYTLYVYITYDENGNLASSIASYRDDEPDKSAIVFNNHYFPYKNLTVKKIWHADYDLGIRPGSIVVQLMENGEVVDEATLSYENEWTYRWEKLYGGSTWTVREIVPRGYINSIVYKGETATITNTAALAQTGQLNWPVPVMGALGCVLFLVGLKLTKKENVHE